MEQLGRKSKRRRRSEDVALADGEPSPGPTEATEAAADPGATRSEEPPPPPPQPPEAGDGGDDIDRISGLPDAVLGEILSLLSTKEAGRTQILASRWRHVWRDSPLVLDVADLYNKPKVLGDDDEALASAVAHILSAHRGPVRRFFIPSRYLPGRPGTVDAWLSSPALDNLQELEFWENRDMTWYSRHPSAPAPASTFRFSATLRVATFSNFKLLDRSVEGIHFPHLKQLGLQGVSISEGSLHTMISSCPVLDCLLFRDNIGVGCLQLSSNSLTSICVCAGLYFRSMDNTQFLQEVIIVDAPCLERFLYLPDSFKAPDLTVISAPKLETLGCIEEDWVRSPRLVFGTTAIEGLNVISLTSALSTIKTLAITTSDHINLDVVIELMKCFPCLEKLYIRTPIKGEMNRWRRKHKDFIKSFDIRLKTILLEKYRGTRSQVSFASFFLLNARELESMRLIVESNEYNEAFFTKQHGMLQMEKRASRGARLDFTKEICMCYVHVNHVCDLAIADPFECRC